MWLGTSFSKGLSGTNIITQDPRDKPVHLFLQSDYNNYSNNNSILHVDDYYLLNISHAWRYLSTYPETMITINRILKMYQSIF